MYAERCHEFQANVWSKSAMRRKNNGVDLCPASRMEQSLPLPSTKRHDIRIRLSVREPHHTTPHTVDVDVVLSPWPAISTPSASLVKHRLLHREDSRTNSDRGWGASSVDVMPAVATKERRTTSGAVRKCQPLGSTSTSLWHKRRSSDRVRLAYQRTLIRLQIFS